MDKRKSNSRGIEGIKGMIWSIPKACIYVVLISIAIYMIPVFSQDNKYNDYISSSRIYQEISETVIEPILHDEIFTESYQKLKNLSGELLQRTELVYREISTIVYYNGITIDEGVGGNEEIAEETMRVIAKSNSDREKANAIYEWIRDEIEYDSVKADKILEDDFTEESGSIVTYETRKGVCLDFSCLYATMAKYSGLKVRIIAGDGFDGEAWVSHAWNQVYIEDEDKWINIDTTFSKAGNYFDNILFELDHKNATIIGEWGNE